MSHRRLIGEQLFMLFAIYCPILTAQTCIGDWNGDQNVDLSDTILALPEWKMVNPTPEFDLLLDGFLDIRDLVLSTQAYGPCGTSWYVCDCGPGSDPDCLAGNDLNDGLTPQTAWRTYDRAQDQWALLQPNDRILLARGAAFTVAGSNRWVNRFSSANNPVTLGNFIPQWASGDEGRPIIWQPFDDHAFDLEEGGTAEVEAGYRFTGLDLRCTASNPNQANGIFLYNEVNDVSIEGCRVDGFAIGIHLAGSNPCSDPNDPDCNRQNDRLTLRNCSITNNTVQGFLGSADGVLIEGNYFENNGTTASFDHNLYFGGLSNNVVIRNNTLYRSTLNANGNCSAASLVVHGRHQNLRIEHNTIYEDLGKAEPGCWGLAVDPGYSSAESFQNVLIRANTVINVGNTGIGTASCVNCRIEDNVIIQEQSGGFTAIAAPNRMRDSQDAVMTQVQIRNNSVFIAQASGIAIKLGTEGQGHLLVSNAVHYAGSGNFSCFALDLPSSAYTVIDYNLCFFPTAASGTWEQSAGSLANWQTSGFDVNSSESDPGFFSPSIPDHNLAAGGSGAAMINSGDPNFSTPSDILGNPRDQTPDTGAFEWSPGACAHPKSAKALSSPGQTKTQL